MFTLIAIIVLGYVVVQTIALLSLATPKLSNKQKDELSKFLDKVEQHRSSEK